MIQRWRIILILLATAFAIASQRVHAAPNVLNGTIHAASNIAPAVVATVGSGIVDSSIFVDYDAGGTTATQLIFDSTNSFGSYTSVANGLPVNHQPYAVMNFSFSNYTIVQDQLYYSSLLTDSAILTWPPAVITNGGQPAGTPPPVAVAGASSRESSNGGTGWGVEFAIENSSCASSCGFNLSEDSWVSAEMAGFLAALKYSHPSWTWFDIKGALRQTAANWATGYAHLHFGFGTVSWPSANAVASTSAIYLQAPGMSISSFGFYARITLYPFRSTRRSNEVVYSCTSSYSWPVKNEYSATDVSGGCGTLIYTSNGTDVTPTFSYAPATSGTVTFIAFTTDGSGNYSRVESEVAQQAVSFNIGVACH